VVADCSTYSEFGLGASSVFVNNETAARIRGVDTDKFWVEKVKSVTDKNRSTFLHADLGPVGKLGRPQSYEKISNLDDYLQGPFSADHDPDVVLIDGRFRVASFLRSLMHTAPGTRIIFDDYHRGFYHVVEEILRPQERTAKQALFIRPREFDRKKTTSMLESFHFVMD
jgi:hypothetical protein